MTIVPITHSQLAPIGDDWMESQDLGIPNQRVDRNPCDTPELTAGTRFRLETPPRVPPELQELILHFLTNPNEDNTDSVDCYSDPEDASSLFNCALVCRAWTWPCQKRLFSWVILEKSSHLDNLIHHLRTSSLARALWYIHRISVAYMEPYFKLGEALPRIAMIAPPNLARIDMKPQGIGLQTSFYPFLFHQSLPARLTSLYSVRTLQLSGLRFIHLTELRRLIACLPGVETVLLTVEVGMDRLGDNRILRRSVNQALRVVDERISFAGKIRGPSLSLWLTSSNSDAARLRFSCSHHHIFIPSISIPLATCANKLSGFGNIVAFHSTWERQPVGSTNELFQWSLNLDSEYGYDGWSKTRLEFQVGSQRPGSSRGPLFDLSHIVGIKIVRNVDPMFFFLPLGAGRKALEELETQHATLQNLETIRLLFYTSDCRGPFPHTVEAFFEDQTRKDVLSGILSAMKSLRESEQLAKLEIVLDNFHLEDLLRTQEGKKVAEESPGEVDKVTGAISDLILDPNLGRRELQTAIQQTLDNDLIQRKHSSIAEQISNSCSGPDIL